MNRGKLHKQAKTPTASLKDGKRFCEKYKDTVLREAYTFLSFENRAVPIVDKLLRG